VETDLMTAATTDLWTAIDDGDEAAVDRLIVGDRDLARARDGDGVSATMHALYRGRRPIAERIAAALPALDVFEAAALARPEQVRRLLADDGSLARAKSPDGFTALHYPAFFGGADAAATARILLDAGAEVDARSENELWVHPLHSAVAGDHDDVVEVLLDAGADVRAVQRHGYTPLHGAAQNGATVTVERLLAAAADPTARTDDGRTPADLAERAGHAELAARLR
jgi:ankyrin repeat protein